ncbi:MAG: PhnD/SsuA/transferrin family substrate-binding protein [Methylococcales bacterium]|nr:PhnD/SsuA/transferrin family substrate-binding protein [Methylococcales bacterium]
MGTIDVEAIASLETLYVLPANSIVELDFALVQRVNSMGLAQILKLFEHWQKQHITISITNVNRMIGVLFKMTGLTRFLDDGQQTAAVSPAAVAKSAPIANIQSEQRADDGKLKLWVHAQNSHQMNGWYFFNTYLQRHTGRDIQLELVHGAMSEQGSKIEGMDIVFTKPFDATRLLIENQFRPLLHPINQTDEVTLLVRADDARQKISDFLCGKVITATADNFVYLLGRFLLEESGSTQWDYNFSGHDIKALQMLLKGQADLLFLSTETYRGLSSLTRNMLREIDQSETGFAFHLFCAAPHCTDVGNAVTEVLLNMGQDSQGRQVLADLGLEGWSRPKQYEVDMLAMLFNRYMADAPQDAIAVGSK